jgi:DNA-binding NarL/FixJ family response regulator
MNIKIGIVDDHELFLKSLGMMLSSFRHVEIVLEAINGKDLQAKMVGQPVLPDIMLIDVNMPIMDGVQTAKWLARHYPTIQLVALSMKDDDKTIAEMLGAGCCAFLLKDTDPNELEKALNEVYKNGYYNG